MFATKRHFIMAAVIAAALLPASADATEEVGPPKTPECQCRAAGALFSMGQEFCIGGQMAVCAMDQNVTTWRRTGRTCPAAMAPATPRPAHAAWKSRRDG